MYGTIEENLRALQREYTAKEAARYAAAEIAEHAERGCFHQRLANEWRTILQAVDPRGAYVGQ